MPEEKGTPIPEGTQANFKTLLAAAAVNRLVLVDCYDKNEKRPACMVCAVNRVDGEFELVPLASMIDGNPYERYMPPNADGGYDEGDDHEGMDHGSQDESTTGGAAG